MLSHDVCHHTSAIPDTDGKGDEEGEEKGKGKEKEKADKLDADLLSSILGEEISM
jgi:hypothetical protein